MTTRAFQKKVWEYYRAHGRHALPWRLPAQAGKTRDPYRILVSEMMLQQTQVDRVVPKYRSFLKRFPTIRALARAPVRDVLKEWSGLGYNRRALYLQRAAQTVVAEYGGTMPKDAESLEKLSGIGPYTARAIATFSWNTPYTFIETNIRSVFIHEFFPRKKKVSDKELLPLIERACPPERKRRREWYYALMDYGVSLKKSVPNPSRRSRTHTKQSKFKGSLRELRGAIVREVAGAKKISLATIAKKFGNDARYGAVITALKREGFFAKK